MEEILDSAAKIFYAKGYHATTIEDVATDVGMLKGSLYYYIKSKEDLLYELLLDIIRQGEAYIDGRITDLADPVPALQVALEHHVQYIIDNQVRVGLFLHEFDTLPSPRRKPILEAMRRYQELFLEIVRQGQKSGVFIAGDPWLLVNGMLGMGNWIYRWYHGPHRPGAEKVKHLFAQILMKGILKK